MNAETDALVALSVMEGGPATPSPFVDELQSVQKIMSALGALRSGAAQTQTPPPCATWGPFVLKEQVGRGNFGIVCRAFDAAVARDVAVKLYADDELPPEPRLMARVRHPNVVTVFGAAVHEGRPGIWMEFVNGRTLAERVQGQGPLPVDEAVRIGVELCRALEAVHDAHLVHGDVKPRNVMEQDDGRVVLMDFGSGAARSAGYAAPRSVSGTPLYMAPEVVLGGAPSAASDLYGLGVLLYYSLTGTYPTYAADWKELRALHARQVQADAGRLAARLRELRPEVPRGLARVVATALAPVDQRYRTAAALRSALEGQRRRGRPWVWPSWSWSWRTWAALFAGLLAASAVGAWLGRPEAVPRTMVLKRLTWDEGLTTDPTRSADGKLLAYASDRSGEGNLDIWVQQMTGGGPRRLTIDPGDDSQPSFSADGSTIAFRSERDGGGVYVVPVLGGEARLLARDGYLPRFSPDGRWISYFNRRHAGALFVAAADGTSVHAYSVHTPQVVSAATWSPDSRRILFVGLSDLEEPDWWTVEVGPDGREGPARATGAFARFRRHGLNVQSRWPLPWDWQGQRVLFSARLGDTMGLWEVGLTPAFTVAEAPVRLSGSTEDQYQPSRGHDGRLVFTTRSTTPYLWEVPLDAESGRPRGAPRRIVPFDPLRELHALSRDGQRLVFTSAGAGRPVVTVKDLKSGTESPLVDVGGFPIDAYPILNPSGTHVLYLSVVDGRWSIRRVAVAGGLPEKICDDCGAPTGWSPDERHALVNRGIFAHAELALLDLSTGTVSGFLNHPEWNLFRGHFSDDGLWISFHAARRGGPVREFVVPFRGTTPPPFEQWIPVTEGGVPTDAGRFSPGGRLLYYVSKADGYRCIWAQPLDRASRRPVGRAFAVQHLHDRQLSLFDLDMQAVELSVAQGRLVFNKADLRGNLWVGDPQ